MMDDERNAEKGVKTEDGCFLKPHIFTLTIPQVNTSVYGNGC